MIPYKELGTLIGWFSSPINFPTKPNPLPYVELNTVVQEWDSSISHIALYPENKTMRVLRVHL